MKSFPFLHYIDQIKTKLGFTRVMTAPGSDVVDAVNQENTKFGSVAYLEDGDTAVNEIPAGAYVIWKGAAYYNKSGATISIGDTLSLTNLGAAAGGIANALNANIATLFATPIAFTPARSGDSIIGGYIKVGKAVIVSFKITLASNVSANTAVVAYSPYANNSGVLSILGYKDAYEERGTFFALRDYGNTLIANTDMVAGNYVFSGCYIANS